MSVVRFPPSAPRPSPRCRDSARNDSSSSAPSGCVFPSELGWMAARWDGPRLTGLSFDHDSAQDAAAALGIEPTASQPPHVGPFIKRLQRYAAGAQDDFLDVNVEFGSETPFHRQVIYHCRRIPWGQIRSYAELAAIAGSPGAARAVGNVMASNRYPLVVPCHRVVGANGGLGGYSARHGLRTKRRLLEREGALSPGELDS
jgi:methylated-DNA-[protein]-cysteine S-methyltransferase